MRRDLLVTALIFSMVGFIAGALYSGGLGSRTPLAPAVSPGGAPQTESANLPAGHPPMEVAARWQELRDRAEASPEDDRAAVELANFLYDNQRCEEAVNWYQKALTLAPQNTDARTDRAACLFRLERYDEAIEEYATALKQEPNKPQALFGLAVARLQGKRDRDGARQAYEQLRRSHPTFEGVEILAGLLAEGQ